MAGKVALQYFKERRYFKHKEELVYYGITKENSKIFYWDCNGNYLVMRTTQESLSDSQIPKMILMLRSDIDMKYILMILLNQMVNLFMERE
jgi:hypothetical protein